MFQSTHPRRVRPCQYTGTCTFQRFNPRTHAGCDHPCGYSYAIELCFNPRTHAGCDSACCCLSRWLHCFNPRTHAGCDNLDSMSFISLTVSIHAPTQGATKLPVPFVNPVEFQSTHPRRVRLNICFIGTRI